MSKRKEYQVLVNGCSVFSGTYASAKSAYQAIDNLVAVVPGVSELVFSYLLAFKPVSNSDDSGFLAV